MLTVQIEIIDLLRNQRAREGEREKCEKKGGDLERNFFFFFFFSGSFYGVHKVQEQRQTSRDQARRRVGSMKKRALEVFRSFLKFFF